MENRKRTFQVDGNVLTKSQSRDREQSIRRALGTNLAKLRGLPVVSHGCCNNLPQTAWLKTIEIYSLTAWRLELQSQGINVKASKSRAMFFLKAPAGSLSHAFLLAFGVASNPGHSSLHRCIAPVFATLSSLVLSLLCLPPCLFSS